MYTKNTFPAIVGRGTSDNPSGRFESLQIEPDPDYLEELSEQRPATTFLNDATRNILAKNDSPDIPFTFSLNPYRGCEHGCIYCYARPTHEYLGYSAGLDFETKILVKKDAPALLEEAFRKPGWQPQVVALSGNTDCYQPIEKKLELTRRCLRVFLKYRNPVGIITKNALITRDMDVLQELAALNLLAVRISITTLDQKLCKIMEPRTSSPKKRLGAIRALSKAGIPVGVNIAPIIPAINESEIGRIAEAAAEAGAGTASYIMVRLPHANKMLFQNWLERHFPDRTTKVLNAIRSLREGELYKSTFHTRMHGTGTRADLVHDVFTMACRKHHLNREFPPLDTQLFHRDNTQLSLFDA